MAAFPPADGASHVLVVDDDSRIRQLLAKYLGSNGYRVTAAADAAEARRKIAAIEFDVLVVDVMMPGEDGLSLTRALSAEQDVPILLLTAKSDGADRIRGLEAGADDYLTKPFEPRELLLRLNNLLKRRPLPEAPLTREEIRFGRFVFNAKREELCDEDGQVRLTDRERQLLGQFAASPDGTLSREALIGETGDVASAPSTCRSTDSAARLKSIPAIPCSCRRCAASVTASASSDARRH
jgi:Response regulators consisting of a CheY-like receiver domain and a winged-helix DNA-binding domain